MYDRLRNLKRPGLLVTRFKACSFGAALFRTSMGKDILAVYGIGANPESRRTLVLISSSNSGIKSQKRLGTRHSDHILYLT